MRGLELWDRKKNFNIKGERVKKMRQLLDNNNRFIAYMKNFMKKIETVILENKTKNQDESMTTKKRQCDDITCKI